MSRFARCIVSQCGAGAGPTRKPWAQQAPLTFAALGSPGADCGNVGFCIAVALRPSP